MLKPLPGPDRIWREISIDFINKLPESNGYYSLIVIVDRLSKGVIPVPLKDLTAKTVARESLQFFVSRHGFPTGIISNQGSQFVSEVWAYICQSAKMERRLSTAWHLQTDRMSPFFLMHGYDLKVLDLRDAVYKLTTRYKEHKIAKDIIEKLAQAADLTQIEIAATQQRIEESMNRH
ncbi:retrovirus polyprotein, putative [Talaromyces stipitatus ATCC 10500]|uniref:Retrovirus polyprotein, putative n=1 Tax=Talaromyces stipitatus (strain ATCC 10500 / CBS 375.48 / QM 6759 / NRRL 1006) TaxID=441959 RepID=B8MPG0_TALSN|nr:retrovirus polyprotein, putative [Talaromyces stipitatus ATCC 10500]EED14399.1 retrovirus polyprotein, putative [Talaromyces stipitatus ATCC 10500]